MKPDKREGRRIESRARLFFWILLILLAGLIIYAWHTYPLKMPRLHNPFEKAPVQVGFYRVTEAIDGDTIVIDMGGTIERIRFIGVDTPETHHPELPVQCFGLAAAEFTKLQVSGKTVRLEADSQDTNRDVYGRLLRYVYTEDGTLLNLKLVEEGYGFAYLGFPFDKMEQFKAAELQARQQNLGLWGGCKVDDAGRSPKTNYH